MCSVPHGVNLTNDISLLNWGFYNKQKKKKIHHFYLFDKKYVNLNITRTLQGFGPIYNMRKKLYGFGPNYILKTEKYI